MLGKIHKGEPGNNIFTGIRFYLEWNYCPKTPSEQKVKDTDIFLKLKLGRTSEYRD